MKSLEQTLEKLVSFKTITGQQTEIARAYEWVQAQFEDLPVFIKRYSLDDVPSMVVTTREGQKAPAVWLVAHMDVVNGSARVWDAHRDGDLMIGRGVFDMKFAIACYIELFKELGDTLSQYDIGIMITGDEEIGGFNGVKRLLDQEGYRGGAAFVPDGGGTWQFEESAKGIWGFELIATGKSGHSSRPWEGVSATLMLSRVLTELYEIAEDFWLATPDHWHLTYNVGMMQGGVSGNQIADEARITADIRFTDEEERQRFEKRMHKVLSKYPSVAMRELWNALPYGVSRDFTLARTFARIAKEQYGIECGWSRSHGSSDARHFAAYEIPALLIWPKGGSAHSEREWVDMVDLVRYYSVMKEWVTEASRPTKSALFVVESSTIVEAL